MCSGRSNLYSRSSHRKPCKIVILIVLVYGDILTGNRFLTSALMDRLHYGQNFEKS